MALATGMIVSVGCGDRKDDPNGVEPIPAPVSQIAPRPTAEVARELSQDAAEAGRKAVELGTDLATDPQRRQEEVERLKRAWKSPGPKLGK